MKKLIFTLALALILNSALLIQNSFSQWSHIPNGISDYVFDLSSSSTFIYAGTNHALYRSSNNGDTWTNTGFDTSYVLSVIASGSSTVFASPEYGGVWISTNSGSTWSKTPLVDCTVWSFLIIGSNLYAGTQSRGIYLSTNNGTSWTQIGLNGYTVNALSTIGSYIFAGTGSGLLYTTNNGANWVNTSLTVDIQSLAIIGTTLFAGTYGNGVYMSTNNGTNWTQTAFNYEKVYCLVSSATNLFAATDNSGILMSINNGSTWKTKNEGFSTNLKFMALTIANNYIFTGSYGNAAWRRSYSEIISIRNISTEIPSAYSLSQNYPNPFNPTTKIRFRIPSTVSSPHGLGGDLVQLKVFDIMGREISTLVNEQLAPGTYETTFDGTTLSSGTYFYKLTSGNFSATKKLTLLK
jgi:hypothetical protein